MAERAQDPRHGARRPVLELLRAGVAPAAERRAGDRRPEARAQPGRLAIPAQLARLAAKEPARRRHAHGKPGFGQSTPRSHVATTDNNNNNIVIASFIAAGVERRSRDAVAGAVDQELGGEPRPSGRAHVQRQESGRFGARQTALFAVIAPETAGIVGIRIL